MEDIRKIIRAVLLEELNIVDEVKNDGKGDLENYFKENPSALNNDYVDNYLDTMDFYWAGKKIKRIPGLSSF